MKELDLRIQRTYILLTKSLYELMTSTPFDKIKVIDICEKAMIRKSTFYKHFADKYELFSFMIKQLINKFDINISSNSNNITPVDYYVSFASQVIDFINENQIIVNSVINNNSFSIIMEIIVEQAIYDIRSKLKEDIKRGYEMIPDPNFLSSFFVGGITQIIREWVITGKTTDKDLIMTQISELINIVYLSSNN